MTNGLSGAALVKRPHEMCFAEFCQAAHPSGAIHLRAQDSGDAEVYSYTVYVVDAMASMLPNQVREQHFMPPACCALAEKMGLNPSSARDSLKAVELLALRRSWMSALLESYFDNVVESEQLIIDFKWLAEGMQHPWILAELAQQRLMSGRLQSVLASVGASKDIIPSHTSVGPVVLQDQDFSVQMTEVGQLVTHENRRLRTLPLPGLDVTVSYYRGYGEVKQSTGHRVISLSSTKGAGAVVSSG